MNREIIKKTLCLLLCAGMLLSLLCACGKTGTAAPEVETAVEETEPEPTPEPLPTPVPTPAQDAYLPEGDAVTVDGTELSGSVVKNELLWVRLDEVLDALGLEAEKQDDSFSFTWRRTEVSLTLYSDRLERDGAEHTLADAVMLYRDEPYVTLESLCDALDIGVYDDEEYGHIYCTPGAGNWVLQEGYTVPILMYHACSHSYLGDPSLCVWPEDIEAQLTYMEENGYTTIFFEDLAEIDLYEKPVIMTFDDGTIDNYLELYPIIKEHNAKITIFMMTSGLKPSNEKFLNAEHLREMSESGCVSIQSHTVNHNYLDWRGPAELIYELEQSKLDIMRATGKEPFVLAYPCGRTDAEATAQIKNYYRFGLRMEVSGAYVTGSDPYDISRYYVKRRCALDLYETLISGSRNKFKNYPNGRDPYTL